ncbi:MAG: polynucleotide adenylyltransferase PcnB [Planctomycetes bacterium]|nr:polynucleotide adenylyltransferase PcnB [Planctomycetota bacterium]
MHADSVEDGLDRIICPREAGAQIYTDHGLELSEIDPDALKVLRRLARYGFQSYLVGGCVRDLLCGLHPKDFDIATSATPKQLRKLFRNSRVIGRRFRLVHIHFGDNILEISTFRRNANQEDEASEADKTTDGEADEEDLLIRHDNVFGTADEDARRRDFTINALFFDVLTKEVIDFVGGMPDLRARRIETIGEPVTRLREDPVRMLRAAKFAGRLDFDLADDLVAAIKETHEDILRAAIPRLYEELQRMLDRGGAYRAFQILHDTEVLRMLLPELATCLETTEGAHDRFLTLLRALDRQVVEGRSVNNLVMLSCLVLPIFEHIMEHEGPTPEGVPPVHYDIGAMTDRMLDPLAARLQMPRRDLYCIKQILMGLRRLLAAKAARRRPSPNQIVRKDYFLDSLRLLAVYARSHGRLQGDVIKWQRRYEEVTGREFD